MTNSVLLNISQDERQRAIYRSHRIFVQDQEHNRSIALQEGEARGITLVAKNALSMNLPIDQIQKLTGLPHSEIEKLRSQP